MTSMATRHRARRLTTAQQAFGLWGLLPRASVRLDPGRLTWTGQLSPSEVSQVYTVRLDYHRGSYPVVRVLDPPLRPDAQGFIPHTFNDGSLCLHDDGQWDESLLIADTLMPWASEWLYHYEIWLWSGHWFGDGNGDPSPGTYPDLPPLSVP